MPTSNVSKPNLEEEEKERLIISPVKDWPYKIRTNTTPQNIDLFQELPTLKLFAKSSMQLWKVTNV